MQNNIHPTAIVDPGATLSENITVGPYAVIEGNVTIGSGTSIGAHAFIGGGTRIGADVRVFPHAALGNAPQDLKYAGEPTTLEIGDATVIREFVTMNRGTAAHGKTEVGSNCFFMAYSHVAHDCQVGHHCILANGVAMAGHVTIEDWAIIGGLVPIHQFVQIGCHTMVGGGWRVPKDVPPYMIVAGDPLKPVDVNKIGLTRRGFSPETIENLKRAHRILFRSTLNMTEALLELDGMGDLGPEVAHLKEFIRSSQRGVAV